jgi:cytochrome c oxidase subunit 4
MADKKKGKRNEANAPKAPEEAKAKKADEADEAAEKDEAAEAKDAEAKDERVDEDEASAEEAAAHGDDEDEHEHDHAHDDHAHDDHAPAHAHQGAGHGAHGPAGHGHEHKPNIKEYMVIFALLAFLTALEVAVTKFDIAHHLMTVALIGLALTKAAIVALYYMHLKHETRVLKLTVALPMAAPTIYALVLISEAAWRLTR